MAWLLMGGLVVLGVLGALLWTSALSPRGVPVIEADDRPFRVRPENYSAVTPPRAQDSIFERPGARVERFGDARLAPGPERPLPDGWRQLPAPVSAAQPATVVAEPVLQPAVNSRPLPPAPTEAPRAAPARTGGNVQVQLGALLSEEGAMTEWNRLRGRVPELEGHTPNVLRFDREGRPSFWRLRVGGLPDRDAGLALCEQVRARGGNCAVLGS
jgi:cell division septation protein DedD